jgi:hypothetical protein
VLVIMGVTSAAIFSIAGSFLGKLEVMLSEDRFFKRPISPRRHPERGRTGAERSARSA